jgi:outer membrane protein OmpA-like peptidoglycan-associated protein
MNRQWVLAGVCMALLSGCTTDPYTVERRISNLGKGAGIGAAVGAGAGTLFGGDDASNAGWGALAGGVVGAAVGAYMDRQERAMRESLQGTGIDVQRTAENTLNLNMPSSITFAFDSATLTPQAQSALNSVASVLNQYPESTITVTGHTDDIGSDSYNQRLSEQRAGSVAGYLISNGVNAGRISQQGLGERAPKFPNSDDANRAQNRRVELAIVANQNVGAQPGNAPRQDTYPPSGRPPSGGYPPAGSYPPSDAPSAPRVYPPSGGGYGYPR